jgi:hypothetical protein
MTFKKAAAMAFFDVILAKARIQCFWDALTK